MLRKRPSWGSPHRIQSRGRTGCTPEESGPPLNLPYGPQRDGAPLSHQVLSGRRGEAATHMCSSRVCPRPSDTHGAPEPLDHNPGPGGAAGHRAQFHMLPQARASDAVPCGEGEAKGGQPAGRATGVAQAWPPPSASHTSTALATTSTQEGASPPPGRGHRRQPPRRFLQAGVSRGSALEES